MRKLLLAVALLAFGSNAALADDRVLDGALGALAGAVVAGPIGLVAGAVTGATAGPAISSSWGLNDHSHGARRRHYRRHSRR